MIKKIILITLGALCISGISAYAATLLNDVPTTNPHHNNIVDIVHDGIMSVDKDGKFRPKETVTREELATILENFRQETEKESTVSIVADLTPKVVKIVSTKSASEKFEGYSITQSETFTGSGFFVGESFVITNYHVIEDTQEISVIDSNNKKYSSVSLEAKDTFNDLALLKVSGSENQKYLDLNEVSDAHVGDVSIVIGHPVVNSPEIDKTKTEYTFDFSVSKGIISHNDRALKREGRTNRVIQIDNPANSGNSGSPVVDDEGKLIGVLRSKISTAEGITMVVPALIVKDFVEKNINR